MEEKRNLPVPIIAAAAVVALILIIFIGRVFLPQGEVRASTNYANNPDAQFFADKARLCQGDFSKLSPEDQKAVVDRAGGSMANAEKMITHMYKK